MGGEEVATSRGHRPPPPTYTAQAFCTEIITSFMRHILLQCTPPLRDAGGEGPLPAGLSRRLCRHLLSRGLT